MNCVDLGCFPHENHPQISSSLTFGLFSSSPLSVGGTSPHTDDSGQICFWLTQLRILTAWGGGSWSLFSFSFQQSKQAHLHLTKEAIYSFGDNAKRSQSQCNRSEYLKGEQNLWLCDFMLQKPVYIPASIGRGLATAKCNKTFAQEYEMEWRHIYENFCE